MKKSLAFLMCLSAAGMLTACGGKQTLHRQPQEAHRHQLQVRQPQRQKQKPRAIQL